MKTKLSIITAILLLGATAITADDYAMDESGISEEMQIEMAQDEEEARLVEEEERAQELQRLEDEAVNASLAQSDGMQIDSLEGPTNTFYGENAGAVTESGTYNSFFGAYSGYRNTSGIRNVFAGYYSGFSNTTGNYNTFIGNMSGYFNTTGHSNTFSGFYSGFSNTTGGANTFSGFYSGRYNTTGHSNTFSGFYSGFSNTGGRYNVFNGYESGFSNTTGSDNIFSGYQSGHESQTGERNTFSGSYSGYNTTSGYENVYIGYGAGYKNETGNDNVFIGTRAGYNETGSNRLYIDNSGTDKPLIYGEFDTDMVRVNGTLETVWSGVNTDGDGLKKLLVLSANNTDVTKSSDAGFSLRNEREGEQWNFRTGLGGSSFMATKEGTTGGVPEFELRNLTTSASGVNLFLGNGARNVAGNWVNASSRALKENIKELSSEDALAAFRKLQPMTYNYKSDKKEQVVGFIAEDVPELVAIKSRDGLSAMDMVAVLTKVMQETRAELKAKDTMMKAMEVEISELRTIKQKVAQLESILTNLALDTNNASKEKVSMK